MNRMPHVNEKIQLILSEVLSRYAEIPFEYFVTITKVDCAPDLKTAKIFCSILPKKNEKDALQYLIDHKGLIQGEFGKRVSLKFTPILRFVLDDSGEKTQELYSILDDVSSELKEEETKG